MTELTSLPESLEIPPVIPEYQEYILTRENRELRQYIAKLEHRVKYHNDRADYYLDSSREAWKARDVALEQLKTAKNTAFWLTVVDVIIYIGIGIAIVHHFSTYH